MDQEKKNEGTLDPPPLKPDNQRTHNTSTKRMGLTFMEPTSCQLSRLRAVNSVNLDKQNWRQVGRYAGRSPHFTGYLAKRKVRPALEPQETLEEDDSETQGKPKILKLLSQKHLRTFRLFSVCPAPYFMKC